MKRLAFAVAGFAAVLCLMLAPAGLVSRAHAADKWSAALANGDGGATYIATIAPLVSFTLQCARPACYSTSTSNQTAANCAHDYILAPRAQGTTSHAGFFLMIDGGSVAGSGGITYGSTSDVENQLGTVQVFEREFDSAADSIVLAQALDAGDPGCNVLQKTINPSSLR